MNKKYLKIVIIVLAICLISVATFYFIYKNKIQSNNPINGATTTTTATKGKSYKNVVIMTPEEKIALKLYTRGVYEVLSRDADGKPKDFRILGLERPKDIKFEAMSDTEKTKKALATSTKIQVLRRDAAGNVIQYRIMKDDSDILTKY